MIGRQDRWQEDLFVACPLRDLVPDDHILKRVDKVLDLSWLEDEVREVYDERQGRPSIAPEAAVRLMLAGLFHGIVHDRKLMRETQVNLAIRWFAGYRLDEKLPDHSSLTRIRQRWGPERFRRIFHKSLSACVEAGLVDGETVHVDATLIRADVSWESLVERHVDEVLASNDDEGASEDGGPGPPSGSHKGHNHRKTKPPKKSSTTDPEATLTTSSHSYRMEPSYKQHTAVDDKAGVIVDVAVTTGEASEGQELLDQLDRVERQTAKKVRTVTADAGYAHAANYAGLEARGTHGVIPPQSVSRRSARIPLRRFKYDAKHDVVRCPVGGRLTRRTRGKNGWWYRAAACQCAGCPLREECVAPIARTRRVLIVDGYPALLRARRRRERWSDRDRAVYGRHRWRAEGVHGEAKTMHGLRRAVRRGLANVAIQAYLTAAVMNLKRLAGWLLRVLASWLARQSVIGVVRSVFKAVTPRWSTRSAWVFSAG